MKNESLVSFFDKAEQVIVSLDGVETTFNRGDEQFKAELEKLKNRTANSYEMPAFAVSIDSMTREDKQHGRWVELVFSKTMEHNEMPFVALLFKDDDSLGINFIRKDDNGLYSGRCYHLSCQNLPL